MKSLLEREAKIELTKNKNARKLEDDQNNSCLILLENNTSAETGSLKRPTLEDTNLGSTSLLLPFTLDTISSDINNSKPTILDNTSLDSSSLSQTSLETISLEATPCAYTTKNMVETEMDSTLLETTNRDPTLMESTVKLTTNSSTMTSLELKRSEPNSCDLSSQVPAGSTSTKTSSETKLLEDLLKEMEKKTMDLVRKMDESNMTRDAWTL